MTLTPGTKLGRYEVRSLLGAGGMGEVYLAYDHDLEREVAVQDPEPGCRGDAGAATSIRAGGQGRFRAQSSERRNGLRDR